MFGQLCWRVRRLTLTGLPGMTGREASSDTDTVPEHGEECGFLLPYWVKSWLSLTFYGILRKVAEVFQESNPMGLEECVHTGK